MLTPPSIASRKDYVGLLPTVQGIPTKNLTVSRAIAKWENLPSKHLSKLRQSSQRQISPEIGGYSGHSSTWRLPETWRASLLSVAILADEKDPDPARSPDYGGIRHAKACQRHWQICEAVFFTYLLRRLLLHDDLLAEGCDHPVLIAVDHGLNHGLQQEVVSDYCNEVTALLFPRKRSNPYLT